MKVLAMQISETKSLQGLEQKQELADGLKVHSALWVESSL